MSEIDNKMLFHSTSKSNLASILEGGLKKGTYLTDSEDIRDYYSETVADDGCEPVVLAINIQSLEAALIIPDFNSIDEPLTYTLKCTEDEVYDKWNSSSQGWEDCLAIVKSVRYTAVIPSSLIFVHTNNSMELLSEYMDRSSKSLKKLAPF